MSEYELEPIRGLPGRLPAGETILWQGAPSWRLLARTAFRTRLIAGYFALLAVLALASAQVTHGGYTGVAMTLVLGSVVVALLHLLAWLSARSTVYTLTNRRIVLRIGIAVPKCINLPLGMIRSVDLAARTDGHGDVALAIAGPAKLGILALWPHARPWKIATPQPTLRAIPEAHEVATWIARACRAVEALRDVAAIVPATPVPAFAEAAAA